MWKLLPWTGRGASGYPQRDCFFCCTTSIILPPYNPDGVSVDARGGFHQTPIATSSKASNVSTGTTTNWYCSSCHCQNVTNEDGSPAEQYTRPMWDEAWNRDRSQLVQHTRDRTRKSTKALVPSSGRASAVLTPTTKNDTFTFCHTCQTNQVLTLNMLAEYLPSEDDPEYREKLRALPEYEASIASRYPPVCANCAPSVQERIAERDQFARSWSLGKWLDLKKQTSSLDLANGADSTSRGPQLKPSLPSQQTDQDPQVQQRPFLKRLKLDDGSPLEMTMFVVVNLGIWASFLATAWNPLKMAVVVRDVSSRAGTELVWLLATVPSVLLLSWLLTATSHVDPLKRSIERARARQLRVEAKGLGLWRTTQRVILMLRLSALLSVALASCMPVAAASLVQWTELHSSKSWIELVWIAALSMLISEVGLTMLAACQLRVESPAPLQLVSRPIVANGHDSILSDPHRDPLLTSLSLDDRSARPSWAADQTNGQEMSASASEIGDDASIPPLQRDADGDAIMEDAAAYSARRASVSSEDDWEQGSPRIPPQPLPAWGSRWPATKASKSSHLPTTASAMQAGAIADSTTRPPSRYTDFQLGPQRFWEPQKPTGLEDVFGRAVSLDDRSQQGEVRRKDDATKWGKWLGFS